SWIEATSIRSDVNAVPVAEAFERNFLHRTALPSMCEAGVVNDAPIADVDTVVRVERARRDEVRGEGRLSSAGQRPIGGGTRVFRSLDMRCIVGSRAHGNTLCAAERCGDYTMVCFRPESLAFFIAPSYSAGRKPSFNRACQSAV